MKFYIFSIFPDSMASYFNTSILARAQKDGLIGIELINIRDFASDQHKTTDDRPFGGGAGMVMKAEPIIAAVDSVLNKLKNRRRKILILSAKGKQFTQKEAGEWSVKYDDVLLICGRYEGIDERVKIVLGAEEISVGPFVLTDGEVAAGIIVSAVTRLIPGVIRLESTREESHWEAVVEDEKRGILEYPHYTRPEVFSASGGERKIRKYRVPKVLLSGDHKKIKEWRFKNSKIKKKK